MEKEEILKRIESALINAGFIDVTICEDGESVLFNDENYDCWALTPEKF